MQPCAIGIIFDESKRKILLVKRRDIPIWVLPGGGIEEGELPEVAVVREVIEETGLKVRVVRQVAEYWPTNRWSRPTYTFECAVAEGALTTGDETAALDFFPLSKLPKPFFPLHEYWLEDARVENPEVLRAPIWQVTWWRVCLGLLQHPWMSLKYLAWRCGLRA